MKSHVHELSQKDHDLGTYLCRRAVSEPSPIPTSSPPPYLGNLRPNILGTHDFCQSLVGAPRMLLGGRISRAKPLYWQIVSGEWTGKPEAKMLPRILTLYNIRWSV